MKWKHIIVAFVLLLSLGSRAQNIPARPNPPRLVNDYANVLSPEERQRLENTLVAYDDSTSNQIAVVLVNSLNDYPIEEYSLKILRDWGIGNKKTNNGVLIVAAIQDRKLRIEVGYGLEGAIPDITANQIIQNDIAPSFRSGDYYEGLDKAAASIIKAAAGEYKAPAGYRKGKGSGGGGIIGFIILAVIIIIIAGIGGGRGGGGGGMMSRRGSGWLAPFILGNIIGRGSSGGDWGGGGGGGWSGGGGGGGFGGFGGGSGGGGGASGGW